MELKDVQLGMRVKIDLKDKDLDTLETRTYGGQIYHGDEGHVIAICPDGDCMILFDEPMGGHNNHRYYTLWDDVKYLPDEIVSPKVNNNMWWIDCKFFEFVDWPKIDMDNNIII